MHSWLKGYNYEALACLDVIFRSKANSDLMNIWWQKAHYHGKSQFVYRHAISELFWKKLISNTTNLKQIY